MLLLQKRDPLATAKIPQPVIMEENQNDSFRQPAADLQIRGLFKSFETSKGATVALSDINLDIDSGELVCLIGDRPTCLRSENASFCGGRLFACLNWPRSGSVTRVTLTSARGGRCASLRPRTFRC